MVEDDAPAAQNTPRPPPQKETLTPHPNLRQFAWSAHHTPHVSLLGLHLTPPYPTPWISQPHRTTISYVDHACHEHRERLVKGTQCTVPPVCCATIVRISSSTSCWLTLLKAPTGETGIMQVADFGKPRFGPYFAPDVATQCSSLHTVCTSHMHAIPYGQCDIG